MDKEKEIQKLKIMLHTLESELEQEKLLTPAYRLAEKLHEALCKHNHTDGCEWYYTDWSSPSYARKRYLSMAEKCLVVTNEDTCLKIIDCLKL